MNNPAITSVMEFMRPDKELGWPGFPDFAEDNARELIEDHFANDNLQVVNLNDRTTNKFWKIECRSTLSTLRPWEPRTGDKFDGHGIVVELARLRAQYKSHEYRAIEIVTTSTVREDL